MFVKAFLSLAFVLLLSFVFFFTTSLAARDKDGHWIPLPACGGFCYTLHKGKSKCSTWEVELFTSSEDCYCHDDDFLHNFVDCVVNSDYCTNIQDVNRSLTYLIDDCEQYRPMPWNIEDLNQWFSVEKRAVKTSVAIPVEPTTYTWTFSAVNSFLEVIPTFGPCGPEAFTTTSILGKRGKRGDIGDSPPGSTVTSTETVHVTITNIITVTVPASTTRMPLVALDNSSDESVGVSTLSGGRQKAPETLESMPIIDLSCPTNITITHTTQIVTTIYSSMDYTIITEDTRSERPTSLYTFWDSTFTTQPTDTGAVESSTSSEGSKLYGEMNFSPAFTGMLFCIILLTVF